MRMQKHFKLLDPNNDLQEDRAVEYPELFRSAADGLRDAGLYSDALIYYEALLPLPEADKSLFLHIGITYMAAKMNKQAEESLQRVIELDENDVDARTKLIELYESLEEREKAFAYLTEITNIRRTGNPQGTLEMHSQDVGMAESGDDREIEYDEAGDTFIPKPTGKNYTYKRRHYDPVEWKRQQKALAEHLRTQYYIIEHERAGMRNGNEDATDVWMSAAHDLIEDFRSYRKFYPWDKFIVDGAASGPEPTGNDISAIATRILDSTSDNIAVTCATANELQVWELR
jgi:general transcription factor 3C polypeptide 3 (transcription factor C subunit 4)